MKNRPILIFRGSQLVPQWQTTNTSSLAAVSSKLKTACHRTSSGNNKARAMSMVAVLKLRLTQIVLKMIIKMAAASQPLTLSQASARVATALKTVRIAVRVTIGSGRSARQPVRRPASRCKWRATTTTTMIVLMRPSVAPKPPARSGKG